MENNISRHLITEFLKNDVDFTNQHRLSIPSNLEFLLQLKYGNNWQGAIKNKTIKIPHCPIGLCAEYDNYLSLYFQNSFLQGTFLDYDETALEEYLQKNNKTNILRDVKAISKKSLLADPKLKLLAMYMGHKIIQNVSRSFNESAEKVLKIDFDVNNFMENPVIKFHSNKRSKYKDLTFNAETWADVNVNLIKNVKKDTAKQVKNIVVDNFNNGSRSQDIVEELMKTTNYSKNRVKTIARDQVSKLYGQRQKAQSLAIGLNKYKWRTCMDERVRDSHQDKEGRIYTFDEDINPGEEVNCRCIAETLCEW